MQIDGAVWAIMREISRLAYNVDPDQITRAKNQLKAQILFSQDGPSGEPNHPYDSLTEAQCRAHCVFLDRQTRQLVWDYCNLDYHKGCKCAPRPLESCGVQASPRTLAGRCWPMAAVCPRQRCLPGSTLLMQTPSALLPTVSFTTRWVPVTWGSLLEGEMVGQQEGWMQS